MRHRLGIALVGMVVAALTLTGVGTVVFASVADRRADEEQLREQTDAIGALVTEMTFAPSGDGNESVRQRIARVTRAMSVEGIGILVVPPGTPEPLGQLPAGIDITDINIEAVRRGETISGVKDGLIYAATGNVGRGGVETLLVLTRERDPIVAPGFRWFLLASVMTVILALVVTVRLSRRLTAPILETSSTAKRIADGDLSARPALSSASSSCR